MRTMLRASALSICLTACQGGGPNVVPSSSATDANGQAARAIQVCGQRGFGPLDSAGGVQKVPHIALHKQFMGKFGYAAISGGGDVQGLAGSCPIGDPIAPVPKGYSPDWFGSWTLYCSTDGDLCSGVSFSKGSLQGHIVSRAWVPSRTYYLYLYTGDTEQFIESYKIGPVKRDKNGEQTITFDSPFENGLTYPVNDGYALEIVHPYSHR